ncbi:hypothetical protein TIFTF001_034323 [Ficus carica]|uniref:Uncharacterized protein n=1 Tax=Ficus carica TaxID=3494 RepID=A0AA88E078_FICCA|nr:hypothetical protein TIFTF001_034323 [Ficus carica]
MEPRSSSDSAMCHVWNSQQLEWAPAFLSPFSNSSGHLLHVHIQPIQVRVFLQSTRAAEASSRPWALVVPCVSCFSTP